MIGVLPITNRICYGKVDSLIFVPDLKKVYKYCPECGLKMKLFNVNVVYKQN